MGRTREYCTLIFLSSALLVRILHATFSIVTFVKKKTFVFYFYLIFSFCNLINLIFSMTITFSRRIRNTVLQLSLPLQFLSYELRHEISNNVAF